MSAQSPYLRRPPDISTFSLNHFPEDAPLAHRAPIAGCSHRQPGGPTMTSPTRPVALVTGASSGIGADLARELARDGHDLVLTARRQAPMEALAAELEPYGAGSVVVAADLSKPGAAAALASAIEARRLTVEVLVNNAGLGAVGRFDRTDPVRISEIGRARVGKECR